MELTFLGTRGEIEIRSRRHRRHSALLVEQDDARIMIDCGTDWLHRLRAVAPTVIVLTHAHDDHAAGLGKGGPVSDLCDCGNLEIASSPADLRPAYDAVAKGRADWWRAVQRFPGSAFNSCSCRGLSGVGARLLFLLST